MSNADHQSTPSSKIPDMTALSIAFPMNFESPTPDSSASKSPQSSPTPQPRPTHRHDAGE